MAKLPKIEQILYPITIPSTGEKTTFRPFTVKEEKILLTAREATEDKNVEESNSSQMVQAIKQIVNNCVTDVDVDSLASFDLEYLLVKIRSKSVNNIAEFTVKDPETGEDVKLSVNLDDIQIHFSEDHTNVIKADETKSIIMRYPTLSDAESVDPKDKEKMFDLMLSCMESVVEGDEVYKFSDFSSEEVLEFVDSLGSNAIAELEKFFDTIPKTRYDVKYTNSSGTEKTFVVQGMESFFI